jgi:hypothetical protein
MLLVALALLCGGVALASHHEEKEAMAMPEPTAEHKELGKWVGKWSGSAEMKPGPYGPGGTMTWTEECKWFGGAEFAVVCKSEGDGFTGPTKGLGIVSYNPGKGVYTHYGVDSNGWSGYAEGGREGAKWTFDGKETMEGMTFHSRFTLDMAKPGEMGFTWSVSQDGKTWNVMMEGTSKKQ